MSATMQTSDLGSFEKLKNETFPLNDVLAVQINFLLSSIDDFIDSSFYRNQLSDKRLKVIENEGDDLIHRNSCIFRK